MQNVCGFWALEITNSDGNVGKKIDQNITINVHKLVYQAAKIFGSVYELFSINPLM